MKNYYLIFAFLCAFNLSFCQDGFKFSSDKDKISIPFKLSNNLVIIPVNINGIDLSFLLDTGVDDTILFSLEETDSITFNNAKKIKMRGLGSGEPIDALFSKSNTLKIKDFVDDNHDVFIILDQEINFSSQIGIPVHGIIGYQFFKNHFVELNYRTKKINVYRSSEAYSRKKLKSFDVLPMEIEMKKPYINSDVLLNGKQVNTKLLVDSGGSDAIWLFENEEKGIVSPQVYFEDYLGNGFSGEIFGKRARVEKIDLAGNVIDNSTISFPNKESIRHVYMVSGRNGSIGSEILKRFHILFDYSGGKMYLKKNVNFDEPFNYNMSGIEIGHSGLHWVKEQVELKANLVSTTNVINVDLSTYNAPTRFKYQFSLKPKYEIIKVRPNSPADLAGFKKGDVLTNINGNSAYQYKLQDIIEMMRSEEGKIIRLEVDRKGVPVKGKFQLKKIL
ncbi:aspartyl protease family protein [Flavobacterium amniphilum]|uniref:retropepsin-like aspartic protease n=1 Tax=Flavobacterium amniphilum TaxID=1834035 RepID=UPI00202AA099|nr:aspartyl protease family protein [Flavobacterium amniphilum]MCL9805524.1 aspartyl protease family protein [Flavobacterium amniphilum]